MKKRDLLKLLENVPDSGEVYLWNGFVGDWVDIGKVVKSDLTKMSQTTMVEACRLEECIDRKDWTFQYSPEEVKELQSNWRRNYKWEFNQYVRQDDVKSGRYKVKTVYMLDAKIKNQTSEGRGGDLLY